MIKYQHMLLFAITIFALSLNAAPLDSIRTKEIQEITIVGGISHTLSLPMIQVNSTTLQSAPFVTPADALQRETGISLTRDGIWATSINIRGLSEQRLLILVDEDRIQTATDIAGALSTVNMASLDKIEVIKGAASVLYGTGAMGGIVNFVSKRPAYSSTFNASGTLSSGFNTVNKLWGTNARLQFTTQQWYLAVNGSFRTAKNTQAPGKEILNSQFHDASWGLLGGIKYAANEEFLVNYQHFGAWDVGLPGGSAFPKLAQVRYKNVERDLLSGEYIITDINDRLQTLSLKVYTQDISRDVENNINPTSTGFPKVLVLPGSVNNTSGAKLTSDWDFSPNQKLILGAEGWLRKSATSRQRIITASDTLFTVFGEQPTPNAKMLDVGAFAQYSWAVVPQKLTFNAGVRLDYIRTQNDTAFNPVYKYTVIKNVRKDAPNLVRTVLFESGVNPEMAYAAHVDLVYNMTRNQTMSLLLANSYRAASIEERFKYIDLAANIHKGNPGLKPERGTFANLNYTFSSTDFQLKTDIFANYLVDLITEVQIASAPNVFENTNISKAFFIGAELEAQWSLSRHFSLLANASYTRARDVDTKGALPQIPPMSGFTSFNYHSGKLVEASVSMLWAATQNDIATGETATDGHIIYNFDLHSMPIQVNSTNLQLFAGVDNLLNTLYTNHLTSNRIGLKKFPEPGRNIYVKAKLNF